MTRAVRHGEPLPASDERVTLRRLVAADLPAFQAYRRDEDLGRFQGWSPQSDDEALQFIVGMAEAPLFQPGEWIQFAIEDKASGSMVGDVGIFISGDGQQAEIGFTLSRPAQGMGFATRAVRLAIGLVFENTPAIEILGVTDARNAASIRLLERIGMRRRSTQDARFKGEACQEHTYVISRHGREDGQP